MPGSPRPRTRRLKADRSKAEPALDALATAFNNGKPVAGALRSDGFATVLKSEILHNAEQCGKLSDALRLVSHNVESRTLRAETLRLRLWLPNLVVFVALVFGVIRNLTTGAAIGVAITQAMLIAIIVFAFAQMTLNATKRGASKWLSLCWRLGLQNGSKLFRRFFEQTFFTPLMWPSEAGVDLISGARSRHQCARLPTFDRRIY